MQALTSDTLKQLLEYSPITGKFTWKVRRNGHGGGVRPGDIAGKTNPVSGYIAIGVNGGLYLAHRLAFLYMTGEWPKKQVDHIDRDPANNAWRNLRPCTNKQNCENLSLRSDNKTGFAGVYWITRMQRWIAEVHHHGQRIHLGTFRLKEDAIRARKLGEKKYFTHAPN